MIQRLSADEFEQALSGNPAPILIDLRTKPELQETGIIPWAIHMDCYAHNFQHDLVVLDTSKHYLIYCRSGNRSLQVLNMMDMLWFENVWELEVGIMGWMKQNKKIET